MLNTKKEGVKQYPREYGIGIKNNSFNRNVLIKVIMPKRPEAERKKE